MSIRFFFLCAALFLLGANAASAARYQRCKDGKTLVWNSQRGVAQEATWSGIRDLKGYATGEGTLTWYRLGEVVNSYTGKMVQGKLEGPVIKEQRGTRLQANFVNGEKAGDWLEPGSTESRAATPTPTPTPAATSAPEQESPSPITPAPTEEAELLPTPIPFRSPRSSTPRPTPSPTPFPTSVTTPTPTATASPSQTPPPTPMATPVATSTPTPTPRSTSTPSPTSTLSLSPGLAPPVLKSLAPSPTQQPLVKTSRLEEVVEWPTRDSLALASPAPSLRNALEEDSLPESLAPRAAPSTTESKAEVIAQFKKQTESVLAEVRDATENFREVDRIETVSALPDAISANVASLAERATEIRAKHGYAAAFYDCGAETATTDALFTLDQTLRDLREKNVPSGRQRAMSFFKRYPSPTRENQKPLWRYLASISTAASKAKNRAEEHLQRAKDFEATGKKADALREYKEIYRVYPNPITADKIKYLQEKTR